MKYILLIICLSFTLFSYAQDRLVFKDGTEKSGKVIEINKSKIRFVADGTTKKKSYNQKDLTKIIVLEDGKSIEYLFASVPTLGNVLLAKISKGGDDKASLYVTQSYIYSGTASDDGGITRSTSGGIVLLYYAKRPNEKKYYDLNYDGAVVNKFKNRASKYLKDCPKLATRIKNGEFGKLDVRAIFKIYDEDCN
ncbi:hypothetical protein [Lacinutrix undariae]